MTLKASEEGILGDRPGLALESGSMLEGVAGAGPPLVWEERGKPRVASGWAGGKEASSPAGPPDRTVEALPQGPV